MYESSRAFSVCTFKVGSGRAMSEGFSFLALLQERLSRLPARVRGRLPVWASPRRSSRTEDLRRFPDRLSGKLAWTNSGALQSWIRRRERVLSCNCPFLQGIRLRSDHCSHILTQNGSHFGDIFAQYLSSSFARLRDRGLIHLCFACNQQGRAQAWPYGGVRQSGRVRGQAQRRGESGEE